MREIELSTGTIEYQDTGGDGPVLVLLHGLMMDASLWDDVIADLSADHRCVAPTLPLGAHRRAMRAGADLSLPGIARLAAEFLDGLGLRIDGSYTLIPLDQPARLTQLIREFTRTSGTSLYWPVCPGQAVADTWRSGDVRPRPAVDSRVGRHVADAEFTGQLPVSQAGRPPRPQLPYFLGGQLGPGISLADRAVITAMAFPAPRLESDPNVIAGGIGSGPVLSLAAAINAPVVAGWPAGFLNTAMPDVIRRAFCAQGSTGQLVSARAGTAQMVSPDPGEPPADQAPLPFILGPPARAPARPCVA
jgi:pimeloyl-ACP methyl ester carboxylesterase